MICKRFIISFISAFSFFFSLFFSFCPVSASSVNCDFDVSSLNSVTIQSYDFSSDCDTSSLDSSKYWFYQIHFEHGSWSGGVFNNTIFITLATSSAYYYQNENQPFYLVQNATTFSRTRIGDYIVRDSDVRYHYFVIRTNVGQLNYLNFTAFSLKITDDVPFSVPDCPVCDECQECPIVPDNPYDEKFDNITKAIYICGAILLVIYFFYCIYRLIIHGLGGRL